MRWTLRVMMVTAGVLVTSTGPSRAAHAQGGTGGELRALGDVLVSSQVFGHFGDPVCDGDAGIAPSRFIRYAEWHRPAVAGEEPPFLFDTGGLLAPHGVARFAAAHDPEAYATFVAELGYRALALGEPELAAPRADTLEVVRELRERGVPVVASNLHCRPPGQAVCDRVVDASDGVSTHRLGQEKLAFVTVLSPEALKRIAPERSAGLSLAPLKPSLAAAVRRAREQGATVVVASVDDGGGAEAAARTLSLARGLPEDGKPDLLFAAGAGEQMIFARPQGFRPAVIAAPPAAFARVRVRRNVLTETFDVLARPTPAAREPHPAFETFAETIGPAYCARWGQKLAGGELQRPVLGDEMLLLAAGAMRQATGAEVALVDRRIIEPAWVPRDSALSASDVQVAVRYDEPLVRAEVEGAWLAKVAAKEGELRALGLGKKDGAVTVNGRPIETRGEYDVVTLRLVAQSGDLPGGVDFAPVPAATVREVTLAHLSEPRAEDPRDAFDDPAETFEWTFRVDLDGTFAGTHVENPQVPDDSGTLGPAYDDSQLQRDNTTTFGFASNLQIHAVSPSWGWANVLNTQYQLTDTAGAARAEGVDQTFYRSTLRYRGFLKKRDAFYVPEPFVENYLETELTVPSERTFRHFLLRPQLGLQFSLTDRLSFKMTGGFEVEAFEPGADILPGVGVQLVLTKWKLIEAGDRSVAIEGNADYFVSDLGDIERQTLRGNFSASIDLFGPLALGVSLNLFVARRQGQDPGVASTSNVFLRVGWLGRTIGP
jgi:hypothetical protein